MRRGVFIWVGSTDAGTFAQGMCTHHTIVLTLHVSTSTYPPTYPPTSETTFTRMCQFSVEKRDVISTRQISYLITPLLFVKLPQVNIYTNI